MSPISRGRRSTVWQIIYMDLMTIMMVFFVILWSMTPSSDSGVSDTIGDQTVRRINIPGDVLFPSSKSLVTEEGQKVFAVLFDDKSGAVLDFDTGGLVERQLVIHGHTDSDGDKDENLLLGYQRAFAVYKEIETYNNELADHIVLCTHADNTPAEVFARPPGRLSREAKALWRMVNAKNRRITIEDKLISTIGEP
jgi:outer membrane protein OmpA-like peptidoglycan-associated protein